MQDEGSPWSVPQGCSIPACPLSSANSSGGSSSTGWGKFSHGFCSSPTASGQLSMHQITLKRPLGTSLLASPVTYSDLCWLQLCLCSCRAFLVAASCFSSSGISGPTQPQTPSSIILISLLPSPSQAFPCHLHKPFPITFIGLAGKSINVPSPSQT